MSNSNTTLKNTYLLTKLATLDLNYYFIIIIIIIIIIIFYTPGSKDPGG